MDPYYSRTYGCHLKNCLLGEKYRIDFVNRGECVVPNNTNYDVPAEATTMVYIKNHGPASIYYGINLPNLQDIGFSYLKAKNDREFKFNRANVKSINFYVLDEDLPDATSAEVFIETIK